MEDIPTIIGLLATAVSTLVGLVAWLVKRMFDLMKQLTNVISDNAKAIEKNTETTSRVIQLIENHLLPPRDR